MPTKTEPLHPPWLDAEIELSEARIRALDLAITGLDNVQPWLDSIETMAVRAARDSLVIRRQREEMIRDQHEAALRKSTEAE